jgi:hypothetical protein
MIIISQKRDDFWLFRCYAVGGVGSYNGWYEALAVQVQTEIDNVLDILAATRQWPNGKGKLTEEMRGACEGLVEIRIEFPDADEKPEHYRILGFIGPGKMEFTLLFGFKETNISDYGPACRSALIRKEGVIRDGNRAPPCE